MVEPHDSSEEMSVDEGDDGSLDSLSPEEMSIDGEDDESLDSSSSEDSSMPPPKMEPFYVSCEESDDSHDTCSDSSLEFDPYDSDVGDYISDIDEGDDRIIIEEYPKTLEYALELSAKGSAAIAEEDFETAAECYSRVLEIQVAHFGELDHRCFNAYYFYGFSLLRNALVDVSPDESTTNVFDSEESSEEIITCFSDLTEYDTKDTPDNVEGESDLDLARQVLDIARVIVEKRPTQSMDNVYVLCALAEVNNYRDDLSSCLHDYRKAINILGNLDKPDLMFAAKTYCRMGLCMEPGVMTKHIVSYYRKAISCCCSKLSLLKRELGSLDSAPIDNPVPDIASLILAKKQEVGRVYNYYRMLKSKIVEVEEVEKNPADLRGAIDVFSDKVRKLELNVYSSSTSTDDEVIHLGNLSTGNVVRSSKYSKSIKLRTVKKHKLVDFEY